MVHIKKKRIQKEQLRCQSRFQRLIFMKTIGKQQSMIQEQKNVTADVLSKGYRLQEVANSCPCFLSLRKDILSHFNSGEHRVPVYIVK